MDEMNNPVPSLEEFLSWPTEEVAERMRQGKPKVCVFPINGTRRWFALEFGDQPAQDLEEAYLQVAGQTHRALPDVL